MIRSMSQKIAALTLLVVISGCDFMEYEDVSSYTEFQSVINKSYKTKQVLIIHGVNMDDPIGKKVHQYSVTPLPGMAGREIKSHEKLEVGTTIQLKKVVRCTNCTLSIIFGDTHEYVIDILSSEKYKDHDIYMRESFSDVDLVINSNSQYTFNPNYFTVAANDS